MNRYVVRKIEEDGEMFVSVILANNIYEASRLAKTMTDENKDANYIICKERMDYENDDYILIGRHKNDLAYLKYLCWDLLDLEIINEKHSDLIMQVVKTDLGKGD